MMGENGPYSGFLLLAIWIGVPLMVINAACAAGVPEEPTTVAPAKAVTTEVATEPTSKETVGAAEATTEVPTAETAAVAQRGTLTLGFGPGEPNFDPGRAVGPPTAVVYEILFDPLVRIRGGEVVPALATSWELQEDNLSWLVSLREDVQFSNGEPFNADAVKFTFDRAMNPELGLIITSRVATIQDVEVVDEFVVKITTKEPDPILPRRLTAVYIIPPKYFEEVGADRFNNAPAGTGSFKVVDYVPLQKLTLEAWDGSWRGAPRLQQLVIVFLPDAITRVTALRAGDVDIAMRAGTDDAKVLEAEGFLIDATPIPQVINITLNDVCRYGDETASEADCVLSNRLVRQALNYAVNKEAIATGVFGGFSEVTDCQNVIPGTFGHNPTLKSYPYDPEKAKALLAEAGYPDGLQMTLEAIGTDPFYMGAAQAVAADLAAIGVQVLIKPVERAVFINDFVNGTRPELFLHGWSFGPALDADFMLVWHSSNAHPLRRFAHNARADENYIASTKEMDQQKRNDFLQKALAALCEDANDIYLVTQPDIWALSPNIRGFEKDITGFVNFDQIWIESD